MCNKYTVNKQKNVPQRKSNLDTNKPVQKGTLYFVLCTLFFVLCTLYSVLCTLYYPLKESTLIQPDVPNKIYSWRVFWFCWCNKVSNGVLVNAIVYINFSSRSLSAITKTVSPKILKSMSNQFFNFLWQEAMAQEAVFVSIIDLWESFSWKLFVRYCFTILYCCIEYFKTILMWHFLDWFCLAQNTFLGVIK